MIVVGHRPEARLRSHWPHHAPKAGVRPDNSSLRMPFDELAHLHEVNWLLVRLIERRVDIAVDENDQPGFCREIEDAVQRWIEKASAIARDLRGHELLVDGEFADALEHAGEREQHAPDMIDTVHVGRIETGNHR